MGRLKGILPLNGKVGGLVFYETTHGALVRGMSSLDKERVASDPAFERSRKAGKDFGMAAQAAGLLRRHVKSQLPWVGNGKTHAALSKVMGRIVRMDTEREAGNRRVLPEHLSLLKGVEWHHEMAVAKLLAIGPVEAEPAGGDVAVTVKAAKGLEVVLVVMAVDFDGEKARVVCSGEISDGRTMRLEASLVPGAEEVVLIGVGVRREESGMGGFVLV